MYARSADVVPVRMKTPNYLAHTEVNHACGSCVYTIRDFVQANSNMAYKTAGQLESMLSISTKPMRSLLNQELVKVITM
jgi:bacterioferritin-associated ferredoxin